MSSSALSQISRLLTLPTSADLAPCIVFLVLYVATIPVIVFRLVRNSDRTTILIRPVIFVVARVVMLAIRAVMSKTDYGEGLLIAELVLISIGFLFLLDPLIAIWKRHISSKVSPENYPNWVSKLALLLRVALLAAIGTGIAGGALTGSALDSPSTYNTVITLRKASTILSMAIVVVAVIAIILTHFEFGLDVRRTGYALLIAIPLIIVSVYRVIQTFDVNPDAAIRSITCFWVLQILFEFIAYILIISISIPQFYPVIENDQDTPLERKRIGSTEDGYPPMERRR